MSESITYDFMQPGDEHKVCNLVLRVFDRFVAPEYCEEGISEFKSYITVEGLRKRSEEDHFFLLARHADKIVGMIDIREHHHISLFFVDAAFQNKGIGKTLFQKAAALCRKREAELNHFTVNSSPYAAPIYEKMGFQKTDVEQIKNGMRFFPMSFKPEAS
ncbi:MAG: GNAT family N-acetyltransferase [Desulfobacteraceae bacterium]|jgi:GNAT superfamily N-acetyltransferase